MKHAASALLLTLTTLAGATEVPAVKALQQRFESGSKPSMAYLFRTVFKCQEVSALRNSTVDLKETFPISFVPRSGTVMMVSAGNFIDEVIYYPTSKEFTAEIDLGGKTIFDSYRMDKKGNLIGEYASSMMAPESTVIKSAVYPQTKVVSFTLCSPKK